MKLKKKSRNINRPIKCCIFHQKTGDDARQQETEELRRRVRLLEDELKRKQQQPEKPYERPREPEPAQPKREKVNRVNI